MSESFYRQDRYIVFKRSDLRKLEPSARLKFNRRMRKLHDKLFEAGCPARSYAVVESDWPEYEKVWDMIENRVMGNVDTEIPTICTTNRWFVSQWNSNSLGGEGWHVGVKGLHKDTPSDIELIDRSVIAPLLAEIQRLKKENEDYKSGQDRYDDLVDYYKLKAHINELESR